LAREARKVTPVSAKSGVNQYHHDQMYNIIFKKQRK